MYLKQIETAGFKSFADKLSISLDDKITCIVGPNGSGKSNIVDAVRWVLGEQSVKSLRGDGTMTDVIFQGSKSRNPLNVASVCLVFDNSDHYLPVPYEEVAIKRRVYRSGENEYQLNGEKCRLKDITDLFLDSGIGKESFNIISQGEVDKILSNSAHDRRSIIEEAAGVLKYKKRKEEALRKLDRTHNNLDRVQDIMEELEVQVAPLEEQSKKAKEYLEQKDALEKYEVGLLAYDIGTISSDYERSKRRKKELEEQIREQMSKTNTSSVEMVSKKTEITHLEKELEGINRSLLEQTKEVEKLASDKKILEERAKYDKNSDEVVKQKRILIEERLKAEKNLALLTASLEEKREEQKREQEQLDVETEGLEKLRSKWDMFEKEYSYKDHEAVNLSHQISLLQSELENGGNLPFSVKAVLSSPHLRGIHNTIGNLVSTEERYGKALETALAASKHFIVVEDEKSAQSAIGYLKEEKKGRATFFPLSVIVPKGVDKDTLDYLTSCEGYLGVMSDFVRYQENYRSIILNQLGNILLCDSLEKATLVGRKIRNRYKIVTLDGDVIHVGGSMTGGSSNHQKSVISLKQELENKKKDYEILTKRIQDLEKMSTSLKQEMKEKEDSLFDRRNQLEWMKERYQTAEREYQEQKEQKENLEKEATALELVGTDAFSEEEERLIQTYYRSLAEKEQLEQKQQETMKKLSDLRLEVENIEGKERLENASLREKEQELKHLEIEESKWSVKLDSMLLTLSEEYSLTFEKAKEIGELDEEIEEVRRKVVILKNRIKELGMVNLGAIEEYDRVATRYHFLKGQKEDLLKAQDTLLEIMDEMDGVVKEEFQKTFDAINLEFKEVFRELFGGGTASLKLTDPENLLETGIDIVASPPGKKLSTISLLSGGEKTLTAISLLFAILNIRTVPFCLFDEVEAALDEVNVDQFGHYLDHYKNKTQFLIITHKKKTMEYADTLYGITMQESGVSKLVSVKLDQVK